MDSVSWAAQMLSAVGSVCAVALALYLGLVRTRRRKPFLYLSYAGAPSEHSTRRYVDETGDEIFYQHRLRLRISNLRGRDTAEDVEVLVTRFETSMTQLRGPLDTRPLRWSDTEPIATAVRIPPGVTRYVDLLIAERDPVRPNLKTARLCVWPEPTGRNRLSPMSPDVIHLAVTARDVDALEYVVKLEFSGRVPDASETFWRNHLTVTEVSYAGRHGARVRHQLLTEPTADLSKPVKLPASDEHDDFASAT